MPQVHDHILVIGARSLIGRRMREAVKNGSAAALLPPLTDIYFTSRKAINSQVLIFDLLYPEAFQPGIKFTTIIVCTPIWLITENVLNRLLSLGMRRLIAFSSTSRFTKGASSEPAERDVVQKLVDGEKSIIEFCSNHKVAWTVFRPTLIYDEGRDENVSQIAAFIRRRGFFPVCGEASGLRQPVHAVDLVCAALQAISAKASFNHAYNLSGGETLTYANMVRRIFAGLGKPPVIIAVPEVFWSLGSFFLSLLNRNNALKYNANMARRMNIDLVFDHADAVHDFGYEAGPFSPQFSDQTASSLPDGSLK